MDRVVDVAEVVRLQVAAYIKGGDYKATSYFVENREQGVYGIITVPEADHPFVTVPQVVLWVRLIDHQIIIERDITDKPLLNELLACGIERECIQFSDRG